MLHVDRLPLFSCEEQDKKEARRASPLFCSPVCMIDQYCVSAITSTFSIHKIYLVIDQSTIYDSVPEEEASVVS